MRKYACAGAGAIARVEVGDSVCVGVHGLLQSDNSLGVG